MADCDPSTISVIFRLGVMPIRCGESIQSLPMGHVDRSEWLVGWM